MSTSIERENTFRPTLHAPLALKHRVSVGEVEQRFTRGRSNAVAVAVEAARRRSPIGAKRAPGTGASQAAEKEQDHAAAGADTTPFARTSGGELAHGARRNGDARAARMRAIERAWKEERARQMAREAEEQRRAQAAGGQQAEECERQAQAKREADERVRLAIERAKRFWTEARDDASNQAGAAERGDKKRGGRLNARRKGGTGPRERRPGATTPLDGADGDVRSLTASRRRRQKGRTGSTARSGPRKPARDETFA